MTAKDSGSAWDEGFRAGLAGKTYSDNPHTGHKASAWAFGCDQGMKERNRRAFYQLIARIKDAA